MRLAVYLQRGMGCGGLRRSSLCAVLAHGIPCSHPRKYAWQPHRSGLPHCPCANDGGLWGTLCWVWHLGALRCKLSASDEECLLRRAGVCGPRRFLRITRHMFAI